MANYVDDLRLIRDERVPVKPEFAVSDEVWTAVREWPLRFQAEPNRIDLRCAVCGQAVMPVSTPAGAYAYSPDSKDSLVLTHLIQRHGWTREVPGGH